MRKFKLRPADRAKQTRRIEIIFLILLASVLLYATISRIKHHREIKIIPSHEIPRNG